MLILTKSCSSCYFTLDNIIEVVLLICVYVNCTPTFNQHVRFIVEYVHRNFINGYTVSDRFIATTGHCY